MNLGHPFLIYGLCKQAGVPLEDNEAWIHLIKAIMVKKDKLSVPRPKEVYDSSNEPSDEDKLRAYRQVWDPSKCLGRGRAVIHPTLIAIPRGGPGQSFHYTGGLGTFVWINFLFSFIQYIYGYVIDLLYSL